MERRFQVANMMGPCILVLIQKNNTWAAECIIPFTAEAIYAVLCVMNFTNDCSEAIMGYLRAGKEVKINPSEPDKIFVRD